MGLLAAMYADGLQLKILNNEADINFGAIYENAIAQELHAHGFELYYFNSKKQGELDFVIEYQGSVLPIEVKSGKDYTRIMLFLLYYPMSIILFHRQSYFAAKTAQWMTKFSAARFTWLAF